MGNFTTSKRDVYQIVTDQILDLLDQGTVPWKKPWKGGAVGWPKNLISKKQYRGINVFLLEITSSSMGYVSPYWLTYKQAQDLGGHVRKGEKSALVVFWKMCKKEYTDETGEKCTDEYPVLRYYHLFNLCQCEGINPDKLPEGAISVDDEDLLDFEPIQACENIVNHMPKRPEIKHSPQARAFYRPVDDFVHMPDKEKFNSIPEYYSTLFHELTHSTGHKDRLDRQSLSTMAAFGAYDYGKEELVAEMGAALLCGMASIETATIENSAAYIDGWRRKISKDRKLVVQAAALAQKAVDFILGETEGGKA